MHLTIELDREVDGRWIADIAELNVLLYAESKDEAIRKAEAAAREIIADRIAHGELLVADRAMLRPEVLERGAAGVDPCLLSHRLRVCRLYQVDIR